MLEQIEVDSLLVLKKISINVGIDDCAKFLFIEWKDVIILLACSLICLVMDITSGSE